jgi:hypothetical protein
MWVCPKCGDYYADAGLAFCLADGTPLIGVDPASEVWSEGTRVIEEKANALRKQKRKLKWRRILLSAMTMLVATLVVIVVAVNSYIYLKPKPEENVLPKTPTPTPTPTPPVCVEADESLERESLIGRFADTWRQKIEGEREKIIAANMPAGNANANVRGGFASAEAALGLIEYEISFPKVCTASVKAQYVWEVRQNVNGTVKVVPVAKKKRFACTKTGETWSCS